MANSPHQFSDVEDRYPRPMLGQEHRAKRQTLDGLIYTNSWTDKTADKETL